MSNIQKDKVKEEVPQAEKEAPKKDSDPLEEMREDFKKYKEATEQRIKDVMNSTLEQKAREERLGRGSAVALENKNPIVSLHKIVVIEDNEPVSYPIYNSVLVKDTVAVVAGKMIEESIMEIEYIKDAEKNELGVVQRRAADFYQEREYEECELMKEVDGVYEVVRGNGEIIKVKVIN